MGDRVLIQFRDREGVSPVLYLHNGGEDAPKLLQRTRDVMEGRSTDRDYSFARCVGIAHTETPGNLSLGVWNQTTELTAEDSHGDAGCIVVDVSQTVWAISYRGGYLDNNFRSPGRIGAS